MLQSGTCINLNIPLLKESMSSLETSEDSYSSGEEDRIKVAMASQSGLPQRTSHPGVTVTSHVVQSESVVATVRMSGGVKVNQNLYDSDSSEEDLINELTSTLTGSQSSANHKRANSNASTQGRISDDSTSSSLTAVSAQSRLTKSFTSSVDDNLSGRNGEYEEKESQDHVENGLEKSDPSRRRKSPSRDNDSPGTNSPKRFNPFDRDLHVQEDHFDTDKTDRLSPGRLKSDSTASSSWTEVSNNSDDITFADLGLSEDHFSQPEGFFGMSSTEELEMAIETCKDLIVTATPHSDRQKNLVKKLVQLRLKLQELKEGPEPVEEGIKLVVGHKFQLVSNSRSKHYCEKCNGLIWGVVQQWFKCQLCGYRAHEKCMPQVLRRCASVRVQEDPTYCLSICPEMGLSSQNYRCYECRSQISYKSGFSEPRICDYSGNYYCELCHWNNPMLIPARVLHNWDFEEMKVCRASKQFLKLMENRAVIRIQDINPMIFSFVEELNEVKKLREELLIMKQYILTCSLAMEKKLLLQLQARQHFVENSDTYSMRDLMDVQKDTLLSELVQVHSSWAQHIKTDCELCKGKGFICELCDMDEVLFPFDNIAVVCSECSLVLHRHCYAKKSGSCSRCERRKKKNET